MVRVQVGARAGHRCCEMGCEILRGGDNQVALTGAARWVARRGPE